MKLVLDWLREYVKFEESADQLAEVFTNLGFSAAVINRDVLDLEITPNRGDCLSVLGLAREFATVKNKLLTLKRHDHQFAAKLKTVTLKSDSSYCSRYVSAIFRGVKIKESAPYIKQRLISYGIKPHNNIIDITNLVMIETGQPLHAFDFQKIKGKTMTIRQARAGEKLELLGGRVVNLTANNLVIADRQRVIDLLGIMGGANSSISTSTKDILLQAAVLDPKLVRRSAKSAQIKTEASYRYERSVDHDGGRYGLSLAVKLVEQEAASSPLELVDLVLKPQHARNLELTFNRVGKLLGTRVDGKLIRNYLIRLGFMLVKETGGGIVVRVPSHRMADIAFEQDIIEEIARLHGYYRLSRKLVTRASVKTNPSYQARRSLVAMLLSAGFQQIESYSLVDPNHVELLGINPKQLVTLENPISPETSALRPTLALGGLKTIQRNAWWADIKLFEIGNVFTKNGQQLNVVIAASPTFKKADAKLLDKLNVTTFEPTHPLAKALKLRRPVELVETSVEYLIKMLKVEPAQLSLDSTLSHVRYRPISNFPPAVRDIAIIVAKEVPVEEIIRAIRSVDHRILIVELFDEFTSDKIGKNKKSLAFHIVFDDPKKTMTDDQANELMQTIANILKEKFSAAVR